MTPSKGLDEDQLAAGQFAPYTDMYMELCKKTTILFPPALHERLVRLAAQQGTSLGNLVRTACERQYTLPSRDEKLAAAQALAALRLPVSSPRRMKREAMPRPEEIAP